MTRSFAIACAVLLLAAGCGDSLSSRSFTADEKVKATAALSARFQATDQPFFGFALSADQADCVANGLVAKIWSPNLITYGLIGPDLTAEKAQQTKSVSFDDASTMAGVFLGCVDFRKMMQDGVHYDALGRRAQACFDRNASDAAIRRVVEAAIRGDASEVTDLRSALMQCVGTG